MKGELVDRARAVAQVFRLARDERDAWVNWPARVASLMAAELEVDAHKLHTVLERQVRGACHFPQYGEEYFKQLTAERLVTRIVKGFPRGSWEKEPGRRNEALDCRVYARAAAAIYGLDRFDERHWRRMEEALARTVERDDERQAPSRPLGPAAGPAGDPQRLHGALTWRRLPSWRRASRR